MSSIDVAVRLLATDLASPSLDGLAGSFLRLGGSALAMANSVGASQRSFAQTMLAASAFGEGLTAAQAKTDDMRAALGKANGELLSARLAYQQFRADAEGSAAAAGMSVEEYGKQVKTNMASAQAAAIEAQIGVNSALRAEQTELAATGAAFATVGGVALAAGAAFIAFAAPIAIGASHAADLQYQLVRLKQATESNADAMPILTNAVNELAIKTIYGSEDASNAFEHLSEMGFTVSQSLYGAGASADEYKQHAYDATEATKGLGYQSLVMGQSMRTDAVTAADLLGSAMNTFRLQTEAATKGGYSAAQMANLLEGAFLTGVPSATELGQAIQMAGGQAAVAQIDFHDFLTTLSVLTQAGMSGSSAGASLSYAIQSMTAPTEKQIKMFSDLGIMTANETTPAFRAFEAQLVKAGGATKDNLKLWAGSVTGLRDMFTAAQGVGMVPLDANFNMWALKAGFLNNTLFDASGKFVGLKGAIEILDKAMAGMTVEEKMNALGDLFNIRSGRAARILTSIQDFSDQYKKNWDKIGGVDVTKNAQEQLTTFKGAWDAFKDSLTSSLAVLMMPVVEFGARFLGFLNDLLDKFMQLPAPVRNSVTAFLLIGAAVSGLILVVAGIILILPVLTALFGAIGTVALPVIGIFAGITAFSALLAAGWHELVSKGGMLNAVWVAMQPFLRELGGMFQQLGIFLRDEFLPQLGKLMPIVKALGVAFLVLTAIALLPIIAVVTAIGLIFLGLITVFTKVGEAIDFVRDHFHMIAQVLGDVAVLIYDFQHLQWTKLGDDVKRINKDWTDAVATMSHDLQSKLKKDEDQEAADAKAAADKKRHDKLEAQAKEAEETAAASAKERDLLLADAAKMKDGVTKDAYLRAAADKDAMYREQSAVAQACHQMAGDVVNTAAQTKNQASNIAQQQANDIISAMTRTKTVSVDEAHRMRGQVVAEISDMKNSATAQLDLMSGVFNGKFSSLARMGSVWGIDLATNFANGIANGQGAVAVAANRIAMKAAALLQHSVPKEGPLHEDDQWGGHLVENLAKGMLAKQDLVRAAALQIAGAVSTPLANPRTPAMQAAQLAASPAQLAPRTIIVQQVLNGKVIGETVVDGLTGQLKNAGINRMAR